MSKGFVAWVVAGATLCVGNVSGAQTRRSLEVLIRTAASWLMFGAMIRVAVAIRGAFLRRTMLNAMPEVLVRAADGQLTAVADLLAGGADANARDGKRQTRSCWRHSTIASQQYASCWTSARAPT